MGHTHGKEWNDDAIKKNIVEIIEETNLDHFPTHSEMVSFFKNKKLACAISKHGGTSYWAEKMNLKLSSSETTFGNRFEHFANNDIFENTELTSVLTSSRYPYDLFVNNCVKIDVKTSKPFINNCNSEAYTFNLEKRDPTCDIFILYCVDKNENIQKKLIIPACRLVGQTQLGIGEKSKWDTYKDSWNIITDFNDFFSSYKYHK